MSILLYHSMDRDEIKPYQIPHKEANPEPNQPSKNPHTIILSSVSMSPTPHTMS